MKKITFLKCLGIISVISALIIMTYYAGKRTGYNEGSIFGYKKGYTESEILISNKIFKNQRDSVNNLDLPVDRILDKIDFKSLFKSISACNDCNNFARCKKAYSKQLNIVVENYIMEIAYSKGFNKVQIQEAKLKYLGVRDVLIKDAFDHFISLNCNLSSHQVAFASKSRRLNTVGTTLVSSYTTSSNFATSLGTVLCGHFMSSLYGTMCSKAMSKIVAPVDDLLKEYSIIMDINNSRAVIMNHIRYDIAELCTIKDELSNNVSNSKHGWFSSTSDLSVDVSSTIKAGIDLTKHFIIEINHSEKQIFIEVGSAEILSNETLVKNRLVENGWFTKDISMADLEYAESEGRKINYDTAINSDILQKATKNSLIIIDQIISPIINNPIYSYDLKVMTTKGEFLENDDVLYASK